MRITDTARKRGITDASIRHAIRNYVRVYEDQGALGLTMFVGPAENGAMLEIGVYEDDEEARIVHAMPARSKYWP